MVAQAAGQNTSNKLSSIDRARKMNIRILTVHSLFKWFKEVDNINKRKQSKANPKIIIKVEDHSHLYCPEIKILVAGYPVLNLSGNGSPFEYAEQNSYNLRSKPMNQNVGVHTCKPTALLERDMKKAAEITRNKKSESGYCELCAVNFDSLYKHLSGKQHHRNIETKYKSLDSSIKECGDFKDFLQKMKQPNDNAENTNKVPSCDIKTNAITPIKIKVR